MSKKNDDKKNVIVVGGGGAGANAARLLSAKLDASKYALTLVTARPFAIHLPGAIRMTTTDDGKLEETVLMPYDKLLIKGNGNVKIGRAASIEDHKDGSGGVLVLTNGERLDYNVLILAPGSNWDGPLSFPDDKEGVLQHIQEWRKKFESADGVVLAGGGAVGVEFAGEVRDYWPKKKVTVVHGGSQLFNSTYPDKFRKRMEKDLRVRGIDVVLGDYIDEFTSTDSITTRNGKKIEGNLLVPTYGNRPATEFVASLGSSVLNERGQIKVRPTLQLESFNGIFAAGDVIDWDEQKQVAKYAKHAEVVVANVLSYLTGAAASKEYKGSVELIVVTNGKNGGAGYFGFLWGIVIGNWLAAMLKSKTLMVSMIRKGYGLDS